MQLCPLDNDESEWMGGFIGTGSLLIIAGILGIENLMICATSGLGDIFDRATNQEALETCLQTARNIHKFTLSYRRQVEVSIEEPFVLRSPSPLTLSSHGQVTSLAQRCKVEASYVTHEQAAQAYAAGAGALSISPPHPPPTPPVLLFIGVLC